MRWLVGTVVLSGALSTTQPVAAQTTIIVDTDVGPTTPLSLGEVVTTTLDRHPLLTAAFKDKAVAEAEVLTAQGGFDPVWRTRSIFIPFGYYGNQRIDTLVVQPTAVGGTTLFGGYRIGIGEFAPYDGKAATLGYGEARAGINVPLWRDSAIDSRRAALWSARLAPKIADAGVAAQKIDLVRSASIRYWNWVEAGRTLAIAKDLLKLAEDRDAQLAMRVDKGDLAAIERQDNQRAIISRRGAVISIERTFLAASYELSLFYRDGAGAMKVPSLGQLPVSLPEPQALAVGDVNTAVQQAIARRPELLRLVAMQEQLTFEADLASNQSKPAFDFQAVVSKDFGSGPAYLRPTEVEFALVIDIPLLARTANGKLASANAKSEKIAAQRQMVVDRITADVRDAIAAEAAARARISLAREELALTKKLADAEREAFGLGQSTMLLVNIRETQVAEAAVREAVALADHQRAIAIYRASTATQPGVLS